MTSSSAPSASASPDTDVLIVGGGPAGLALACALDDAGLRATVVDPQGESRLAAPPPDGRDIALTHRAMALMERLGLWARLDAAEVAPLREAHVYNGRDTQPLKLAPRGSGTDKLGTLVPNSEIRRASFEAVRARPGITLITGSRVTAVHAQGPVARVEVCGPDAATRTLGAALVVAADSRYSETRRRVGIGAQMRDFGRTVIVCRMRHPEPNQAVAQECFLGEHTLAVLPMNGGQSSIVITLAADEAADMMQWEAERFETWVTAQLADRLGRLTLVGERHSYPLVAVYAHRFATHRFALIGDAAVGMHPVTAHGYNFGLYGVDALTRCLVDARKAGRDIGDAQVLKPFEQTHRQETALIYHGTNAIVTLFTDEREPARLVREAVLKISRRLPPLQDAITRRLTESTPMAGRFPLPPLPPLPRVPAAWLKSLVERVTTHA